MNEIFDKLKILFNNNGFRLYMIGGTSRDYLLNQKIDDYDFVTDALPEQILKFLDCDRTFEKYGSLKYFFEGQKVDITTLRIEGDYNDHRHPSSILFTKNIEDDYVRRDFTINALYIDENYNIIDPTGTGLTDLKNHFLRFIGDPLSRIKEDPLRILRAYRFMKKYSLSADEETLNVLKNSENLLQSISRSKVDQELKKF